MRELRRILLVEGDPEMLASAASALARHGYTVMPCSSTSEAIAQSPAFRPDLVLLEVPSPLSEGQGTLEAFRRLEATSETPVVFMTATAKGRATTGLLQAQGCLGVIRKPFDPADLPRRLGAFWGRHRRRLAEVHRREFEALRRAYVGELPAKIDAMRAAAAALARGGWARPELESLYLLAHRMSGTAGLYGLAALNRSAGVLEAALTRLLSDAAWPPPGSPAELVPLVEAVSRTTPERPPGRPGASPGRRRHR